MTPMTRRMLPSVGVLAAAAVAVILAPQSIDAQRGGGAAPAAARTAAPIDLTGYWVSVVTEDWRYRMVTPAKGDYASVPLNADARKIADAWDPAKDEAGGNACKSYGAANIMRVPGRLHITWQDDTTLKIETDAGTQTRLLRFGETKPPTVDSWQGHSAAVWEVAGPVRGAPLPATVAGGGSAGDAGPAVPAGRGRGGPPAPRGGSLKVVTTKLKPGYLRKNGIPYSEQAVVTEYFDRHDELDGVEQWFTVTTIVEDSKYLNQPFITSTHFKKEADAAKWRPTPCTAK
jgi:hypothetical protein